MKQKNDFFRFVNEIENGNYFQNEIRICVCRDFSFFKKIEKKSLKIEKFDFSIIFFLQFFDIQFET